VSPRVFGVVADGRRRGASPPCSPMRPEIAELVELLARSVYQRWQAGEIVPDAAPVIGPEQNQLPSPTAVAYDLRRNPHAMELLGCASTPTPGTAQTGRPKPP
jgi:hypothetical protein